MFKQTLLNLKINVNIYFRYTDSDLFEIFYIDPTKVVIHIKINDEIQMEISSRFGTEILDVDVLGNLKYAIASTMETFIFCKQHA